MRPNSDPEGSRSNPIKLEEENEEILSENHGQDRAVDNVVNPTNGYRDQRLPLDAVGLAHGLETNESYAHQTPYQSLIRQPRLEQSASLLPEIAARHVGTPPYRAYQASIDTNQGSFRAPISLAHPTNSARAFWQPPGGLYRNVPYASIPQSQARQQSIASSRTKGRLQPFHVPPQSLNAPPQSFNAPPQLFNTPTQSFNTPQQSRSVAIRPSNVSTSDQLAVPSVAESTGAATNLTAASIPRTRRMRPRKHFAGFTPYTEPIPSTWRIIPLEELTRHYPNHLHGHILRRFVISGVWEIQLITYMHPDARAQLAKRGADFLRKRLRDERQIVREEQMGRSPLGLGFKEADIPHPLRNWYRPHEIRRVTVQSDAATPTNTNNKTRDETQGLPRAIFLPARPVYTQTPAGQRRQVHRQGRVQTSADMTRCFLTAFQQVAPRRRAIRNREALPSRQTVDEMKADGSFSIMEFASDNEDIVKMMYRIYENKYLYPAPIDDDSLSRELVLNYGWSPLESSEPAGLETKVHNSLVFLAEWMQRMTVDANGEIWYENLQQWLRSILGNSGRLERK